MFPKYISCRSTDVNYIRTLLKFARVRADLIILWLLLGCDGLVGFAVCGLHMVIRVRILLLIDVGYKWHKQILNFT